MAIHKVKRGDKVYLSEYKKVREGKKVKSIFVRYIGPEDQIKEGKKPKRVLDRIQMSRSHRAGDVRLLWKIAEDLDFVNIIDRICCGESYIEGPSPAKFLTVWAINRVLDPESCTQLERWVKTTDLPLLTGIEAELFTKDAFLSSLDFVCHHDGSSDRFVDYTASIDDALYQYRRKRCPLPPGENETVAYDLTSVLFFGVSCPLAVLGRNSKHVKRHQVNLALLVSKYDKFPISNFVYSGNRKDASTVKNLLARLDDTKISPGTIIWDRGNVSEDHVKMVELAKWKLICGVPKSSNEVVSIIDNTNLKPSPTTFVQKSRLGHIYAMKSSGHLFGRNRSVTVYLNQDQQMKKINATNEVLAEIGKKLSELSEKGKELSEAEIHKRIDKIVGSWGDYVHTTVKRKSSGPRMEWRFKSKEIEKVNRSHGKYLLLSTDESL